MLHAWGGGRREAFSIRKKDDALGAAEVADEQRERRVPALGGRELARPAGEPAAFDRRVKERAAPAEVAATLVRAVAAPRAPDGAGRLVDELELDPVDELLLVLVVVHLARAVVW